MTAETFHEPDDPGAVAQRRQTRASRPQVSSWVSASAGTGKTFVLTQRVLRLLLSRAPPSSILCLTFTKAAAAEMTNRIAQKLGYWALMDIAALREDLKTVIGQEPTAAEITRARTLFASWLDEPGGMRIQTIHAFCQALLKRFPLETGIPPHFQVIEEGDQRFLLDQARDQVLAAAAPGAGRYSADLARLTTVGGPNDLTSYLGDFLSYRGHLRDHLQDGRRVAQAIVALYADAGFDRAASEDALRAKACREAAFDRDNLAAAVAALATGKITDADKARIIADWLQLPDAASRAQHLDGYCRAFLTARFETQTRLATQGAIQKLPDLIGIMSTEAMRLEAVWDRIRALRVVERSAALARLGAAVHQRYEREKGRRAVLDFDDLILKAQDLLTRRAATEWVLFKLDGAIDHILVDEAQDTSPDQWYLVEAIAREFFAGTGVEGKPAEEEQPPLPRTVFAVGDIKQSIYSFQGADPVVFDHMRGTFGTQVKTAKETWDPVDLDVSFRSVQTVLDVVDQTFAQGPARAGVADGNAPLRHTAWRQNQQGLVEVWPVIAPVDRPLPERWTSPETDTDTLSTTEVLARQIAGQIRCWLDGNPCLVWDRSLDTPVRRPARASDIMILVRRRTALVDAMIRSLKANEIDVAGSDRMALVDQLAVQDLLALADFLLLPEDDLTLATVLKGPLFGLDDDDLFTLAHGRGKASLWSRLQAAPAPYQTAADALRSLLTKTDFVQPYELLKGILAGASEPSGRELFWSRLGPDALEPLDELLNLALKYQQDHPPSLQGFLHWVRRRDVAVKRDMESVSDAVRIMTVHGSKGLQTPIVILPDTTSLPHKPIRFLWPSTDAPGAPARVTGLPLINPSQDDADKATAKMKEAASEAQRREYNRLLYVAMTRAEDALIVCGARGKRGIDSNCWHELVEVGLKRLDGTIKIERAGFDEPVLQYGRSGDAASPKGDSDADNADAASLLASLKFHPKPAEQPLTTMTPSRIIDTEPAVSGPFDTGQDRFRRGILIHQMLQNLPDIPPADRLRVATRFLSRPGHGLPKKQQHEMARETLAVLDLPDAALLFGPGSIAETPIAGRIGDVVISGQIDRLAIMSERIALVDYKTNSLPPDDVASTPSAYLRQMAAYRALLARLYPDRVIESFLLWTATPYLMRLDDDILDPHAPAA